jgi:hypothetical protein
LAQACYNLEFAMSDFTEKWTSAAAREVMKHIEEAIKAEREACARIAEESIRRDSSEYGHGHDAACDAIAAKIRARKDPLLPE